MHFCPQAKKLAKKTGERIETFRDGGVDRAGRS
jgi:hypothetical protein